MAEIPLTQGKVAIVDDAYAARLLAMGKWTYSNGYAVRDIRPGGRKAKCIHLHMHRVVLGDVPPYPESEVDHRDGNGLNNCKSNLRVVTSAQNSYGRRRNANKKSSIYKGAFFDPSGRNHRKPWRAMIRVDGTLRHLGRYPTEQEAAAAYDQAAVEYFGEYANTNFKEVVSSLATIA